MTPSVAAPSFEALLSRDGLAWMGQNTTHLEPPAEVIAALEDSTRRREFQFYAPALGFERRAIGCARTSWPRSSNRAR